MIYLLHAGAVPIGYDRDMSDIYLSCWDEDCLPTTMDRGRLHETEPFQLPDVVLSNTPPPSPGHQVCGCCGAHPCQARTQTQPLHSCSAPCNTPEGVQKGVNKKTVEDALTEAHDTSIQNYLPHLRCLPHQPSGAPGVPALVRTPAELDGRAGERDQWRQIGCDLRKIGDHFQLHTSEKWRKNKLPLSPAVPSCVCRCVVASLVCLAWWRLYSKLY